MPQTPYLLLDLHRLDANLDRTAEWADLHGVTLRPHGKTHKSLDIASRQLARGAVGLTVATLGEAEVFAAGGVNDIFIAYPLLVDDQAAARLHALTDTTRLGIGVDSVEGSKRAGRLVGRYGVEVVVEVDSGHHRSGCQPSEAASVAIAAEEAGARVRGVFTFPGHSYSSNGMAAAAADEAAALATASSAVVDAGLTVAVVSGGSTPSLRHSDTGVVTELRPGVYALGDAQQWELGAMVPEDIALTCVATVVSHAGGRAVLDSGGKALAADRASYNTGAGRLLEYPDARIVLLSEHHAVVEMPEALPPLGSQVKVVPNHCCAAVNLADHLWVKERGELRSWPVSARGRNN